jgi:Na+-translocating ferredoxin:NAD+ oxidoreductase RnfD subunit
MSVWSERLPVTRPLLRFLRTPKGLLLIIFVGLLAVSCLNVDATVVMPKVIVAAVTAAVVDIAVTYVRRREWILPDGAVLTGMIVAFVLTPQESWFVLIVIVAGAILSKHALRTHWSNIVNPAAFALVVAAIVFKTGQSWWGALPDLGIIGAVVILAVGLLIADRINKLPMILAFFGAYFTLLTVASLSDSAAVAETFRTPDLQAALFFAFFMLDDPPTSPVRHEDQIVFGMIAAAVAYFILMQFGGVYFLPAGLLAGNVWESGRRLVLGYLRGRETAEARRARVSSAAPSPLSSWIPLQIRSLRVVSGVAIALVALVLVAAAVATPGSHPSATTAENASVQEVPLQPLTPPAAPYPFLASFNGDLTGTYSQTGDATQSSLTIDATTTGDLTLKLHLELVTTGGGGQTPSTVTVNKVQLLSVDAKAIVCNGQLTAFNRQLVSATCDGAGPYQGVQMTFEPILNTDSASTLSGSLSGTMQRTP